jgi:hypothetical protein
MPVAIANDDTIPQTQTSPETQLGETVSSYKGESKDKNKGKDKGKKKHKHPGSPDPDILPGVEGKDYKFIQHQGTYYVVYSVRLLGGGVVRMAWRLTPEMKKKLIGKRKDVPTLTKAQFNKIHTMGVATDIQRGGDDLHPFEKFLRHLRDVYGAVSWLHDRDFVMQLMEGWAEGWSTEEIAQSLRKTRWYQKHTEWQRSWVMMGKADKQAHIETVISQMRDILEEIYGPLAPWQNYIKENQLKEWAKKIASGAWGTDPSDGLQIWAQKMRDQARKIEGTVAYQEYHAALNKPEDMLAQIRQDAFRWLGPAVPDMETLKRWADDLVSGKRSEADWQKYMQRQAQNLYPFLGPYETWQDRAAPYKEILERTLGKPVSWEHPLLQEIGVRDDDGNYTGATMNMYEFERVVRRSPEFWTGEVAAREGWDLLAYLMDAFLGVR